MKMHISTTVTKTATSVDASTAQSQRAADRAVVVTPRYHAVVGLDVGDRQSHYCVLDLERSVVAERDVQTTDASGTR